MTEAGAGFTATGASVTEVGALPEKRIVVAGKYEVAGIVAEVTPLGMVATLEFSLSPTVMLAVGVGVGVGVGVCDGSWCKRNTRCRWWGGEGEGGRGIEGGQGDGDIGGDSISGIGGID